MFNATLCKDDPNCQITVPLCSSWCVEDSIDTLNLNFTALDVATCNILFSANETFNPFLTYVQENSAKFENAFTFVSENSAKVEGAATTVQMLSGSWLTPISIIYKDILDACSLPAVNTWVNANFPPQTGNCINYINGQKLYIYSLKYANITRTSNEEITVPGYVYNYTYSVRVIRRTETRNFNINIPAKKITSNFSCLDKYVGDVCGYIFCLINGQWEYVGLIPGYD